MCDILEEKEREEKRERCLKKGWKGDPNRVKGTNEKIRERVREREREKEEEGNREKNTQTKKKTEN